MGWECRACGRVHDEDPGTCVCGSADQRQRRAADGDAPLDTLRRLVADPSSRHLGTEGRLVSLGFRLVLVLTVLLVLAVAAAVLWP